jgi:hypothetical protein
MFGGLKLGLVADAMIEAPFYLFLLLGDALVSYEGLTNSIRTVFLHSAM